jgi:hypothetical protein
VHYDDTPPYYTVRFASGERRETTLEHLQERSGGGGDGGGGGGNGGDGGGGCGGRGGGGGGRGRCGGGPSLENVLKRAPGKPPCAHGVSCYRLKPGHWREYDHPAEHPQLLSSTGPQ